MAKVLIVDDERPILEVLSKVLEIGGHEVESSDDGREALKLIAAKPFDVVLCDMRMTPLDGITVLSKAHEVRPGLPFIMLTAFGSVDVAKEAMRRGAFNFMLKPWNMDELLLNIQRAVDKDLRPAVPEETQSAGAQASEPWAELVRPAIDSDKPVIVMCAGGGETIARAIHDRGSRKRSPCTLLDCATLPEPILEVEMLGCVKGAVPGIVEARAGVLESANGGTVIVDEISWMPHRLQKDLVNLVRSRVLRRIGGLEDIPFDVRVIATTKRDPDKLLSDHSILPEFHNFFGNNIVRIPRAV